MAETTTEVTESGASTQSTANPNEAGKSTNTQQTQKADTKEVDKKYTDADLDKIINQKFADWQKKKTAEIDEAKKLAEMNEAQKAKYETEKLEKQLEELMMQNTLSQMTKTARSILSESDITVSDDLLAVLVSTDAEKTNAAVSSFATMFQKAVDKAVKEALKGNPPKTGTGKSSTMTKEQVMAIKDPVERQKIMMQNKEMFGL